MSDSLSDEIPENQISKLGLLRTSIFGRLFFTWISPLLKISPKSKINFDFMPDLPKNYQHAHYSIRMKYHFEKNFKQLKDSSPITTSQKKAFFIKLIYGCFKFDILAILLLMIFEKLLIFSASFCFQKILEIPTDASRKQFFDTFSFYASWLLFLKTVYSIATESIGFYIVS